MARKSSADVAKAKAAKQKKMAIGLSVVLVLAMGYAFKTMSGLNGGGSKPVAAPAVTTTPTSTTPAPTATPSSTASLAAPTLAASTPNASAGAPTTGAGDLVSAVTPTLDVGQMQTFDKFATKDPFENGAAAPTATRSGSGLPKTRTKLPPVAIPKTPAPPKPPAVAPASAVLSVNGTEESVSVGGSFPAASPMFQLGSLTASTAKVSVIGGTYSDGSSSLTLTVGKPVTLVNTANGTRYTLILYPQGTTAPAGAPSSTSAGPVTTTTSTTTTPGG